MWPATPPLPLHKGSIFIPKEWSCGFLKVLNSDYPGVQAILGEERFVKLASHYSNAYPSRHTSIRWYGQNLATFLNDKSPWFETPVLAEMATFEWVKGEVTDAADNSTVEFKDVAAVAPDQWAQMFPQLIDAMRLVYFNWNVVPIWTASQTDETLPPAQQVSPAQPWLVWRQGVEIYWRSIDQYEEWALGICQANRNFGELCDGMGERVGISEAPMRAAGLLKQWVTDGLLAAI